MYYTAGLLQKRDAATLNRLVRENSLDQVAWGWFTVDLLSDLLPLRPLFRGLSRGEALERTWATRNFGEDRVPALSAWGALAASDGIPALPFNATGVEPGR